ncbi:MAG: hypothetical protein ACRYG8_45275 [Janthinobacterium lividum]
MTRSHAIPGAAVSTAIVSNWLAPVASTITASPHSAIAARIAAAPASAA